MNPVIKQIIENQPDMFEKLLLCLIYTDRKFYDKNCKYLCKAITPPQKMGQNWNQDNAVSFIDDFDIPEHNALYHVLDTYYQHVNSSRVASKPMTPDIFKMLLTNCAIEADKGVNEDELETVSELMDEIVQMQNNTVLLEQMSEGFPYWFQRQRVSRLTNQVGLRDDWNPEELQAEMSNFKRLVDAETSEVRITRFGEGMDRIHRVVNRFPTGISAVDAVMGGGVAKGEHMLVISPTGCGKCLGKGTPVVMYDGSVKAVEDVVTGDRLMGPDGSLRTVTSTTTGTEQMYRIKQKGAEDYEVNKSHILSLKIVEDGKGWKFRNKRPGDVINISVEDYLKESKTFKHRTKGWMPEAGISEFDSPEPDTWLPPYALGMWLGDGHSRHFSITSVDEEVISYFYNLVESQGHSVRQGKEDTTEEISYFSVGVKQKNKFLEWLRKYDLVCNKHIPDVFMRACKEVRLQVLAGLMDTDGSYNGQGTYDLCMKSKRLVEDTKRLARSCGLRVVNRKPKVIKRVEYPRIGISGPVEQIPCLINRKIAGVRSANKAHDLRSIEVEDIGTGQYYGFTLDGPDRLFLLGDYTVTHNTVLATQLGSSFGLAKLKGLLIYTEQDEEALEMRILSARCGIPFKMVKDGLDRTKLTPEQCQRIDKVRAELDGHLFMRAWESSNNADNFREELRSICETFIEEHGDLDFLIFDWLGAALTNDIANNIQHVRVVYQLAADFLGDFAAEKDIAVVSFAQAHPTQSLNKIKVDNTTISECKTMGNKASYIAGITALYAEEDSADTFSDDQWLYFSKGRKIKNMKIPISRKFDFQKFEDRGRG